MNSSTNWKRNWLASAFLIAMTAAFVTAFYKGMQQQPSTAPRPTETKSARRARRSVLKQVAAEDLRKFRDQ